MSQTILFAAFFLSACAADPAAPPAARDLIGILKTRPSLTRFTEALEATGIAASLKKDGSYTIFAPIDAAVNGALDQATISHHIVPGRITFSDFAGETISYRTLHADELEVDATAAIRVEDALMIESDIVADNGIIHVIDKVLIPGAAPTSLLPGVPLGLIQPAAGD